MTKKKLSIGISQLFLITIIFAFAVSLFNGCKEDNPLNPTAEAKLKVTHASPDAPNIDVYVGSTIIGSNLSYLNTLSYTVITGNAVSRIRINSAGTSTTLIDTSVYFQKDLSYSFFAFDSLQAIQPLILGDDLTSPGTTNSKVRLVYVSPNGPSIDVGATSKIQPWFAFYSFPPVKNILYRAVTGGTYNIYVNGAGTTTTLASLSNVDLAAGKINTLMVRGFFGGSGSQAFGITVIPNN